jgi:Asp-tRNA(Asn)/Glu-tRNA(Gln) amidotransferase A subunit family amidase
MATYTSPLRLTSQGIESFEESPSRLDTAKSLFQRPLRMNARVSSLILLLVGFPITLAAASLQDIRQQGYDVFEATILELQDDMATGRVTAVELVDAYLARIAAYDQRGPMLNAIIRLNPNARAEAALLDQERATHGPRGPLHGIPIILKDNFDTFDMPTTAGSIALAGLVPPDDAFQVRQLRDAGAIILGKANMHELALSIRTNSSLGGQTRNPYDPSRYPGGSSGGTGAAIAASFAAIGWGTDTGGSIRIPSSHNNLFGLRLTKGLSSSDGIIPLGHTQDEGGPMARTATDLAIGLDAIVGHDAADPATLRGRALPSFVEALDSTALQGARLGVLTEAFGDAPEGSEVRTVIRGAIEQMKEAGADVIDSVEIPNLDSLGRGVTRFEFKFDLMDYLAAVPGAPVSSLGDILDRGLHLYEIQSNLRWRDSLGTRDGEEYRAALAKRAEARNAFMAVLEEHQLDALVYPTIRRTPAHIGDPTGGNPNGWISPETGLPALSVPAGLTDDGLPVGMELLGAPFSDARLLALGFAFERATHPRRAPTTVPPLVDGRAPDPIIFGVAATGPGAEAHGELAFDVTTGVLSYDVTVSGVEEEEIHAVAIHLAEDGKDGPVLHRLSGPGTATASGQVTLTPGERDEFMEISLYLVVYAKDHPTGAARGRLALLSR